MRASTYYMKKPSENQLIFHRNASQPQKTRPIEVVLCAAAVVLLAAALWTSCSPARPAAVELGSVTAAADGVPFRLDLNEAGAEELECLPGIGPVLAESILSRREELGAFRTREDVLSVSGIGEGTYEKIEPYITY